jgi:hypothetical protein
MKRKRKRKHRKDRWLKVDKLCARWSRQYRKRFGRWEGPRHAQH